MRKIFGSNRDEVTGDWGRLPNKELNDLHYSPYIMGLIISRRMRWTGHVARTGDRRGAYSVLVGRPEGKIPNVDPGIDGRIILKWISMKWIWEDMDWTDLAEDRDRWRAVVNAVMNLSVP
jgi:hypothetical protein